MEKRFMKGCEAIAEAAVRGGCRFFAGYPITPQNEIPEYFARRMPEVGGIFLQGESEIASINMVNGAAFGGTRAMTSSSSCGISLKAEGVSQAATDHLPIVICSVMRGGPGVGPITGSQQDYWQATKAHGNGGYKLLVFTPESVQEAVDMTYHAWDYAEKYRNPVMILIDGVIGVMMEPIELPDMVSDEFLAENKAKEGVVTTPSGLQYKIITKGNGAVPADSSKVKVNYKGTLIDGTEFDSSYKRNEPATFRANQVIKGWTEALTMMPVGSKWELYIPYDLAYGSRETGSQIKPFSTLIFEVELLGIEK